MIRFLLLAALAATGLWLTFALIERMIWNELRKVEKETEEFFRNLGDRPDRRESR